GARVSFGGFLRRLFGAEPIEPGRSAGAQPGRFRDPRTGSRVPANATKSFFKKHRPPARAPLTSTPSKPYALARVRTRGQFLDLRVGEKPERLQQFGLPRFQTPEELALWLKVPLKTLAWLGDYHGLNVGEKVPKKQHYHYKWMKKRSGK